MKLTLFSDALIIVQLGGNNDFFTGDNKTFDVAENARRALENMARQGARRVVALNLADLSQAPGVRSAEFSDELKMRIAMLVAEANMVCNYRLARKVFVVVEFKISP